MRRLLAAGLPVVLQVGALCAPLVHAHLDAHHDDHHDAPAVHAHVGGHPQGPATAGHYVPTRTWDLAAAAYVASGCGRTEDQPAVGASDEPEQTTRLQIFVAVAAAPFTAPALPPARFTLAPALASVMRRRLEEVRSHGPPLSRATTPRAPPAVSV